MRFGVLADATGGQDIFIFIVFNGLVLVIADEHYGLGLKNISKVSQLELAF